jgi:hypothetical protein
MDRLPHGTVLMNMVRFGAAGVDADQSFPCCRYRAHQARCRLPALGPFLSRHWLAASFALTGSRRVPDRMSKFSALAAWANAGHSVRCSTTAIGTGAAASQRYTTPTAGRADCTIPRPASIQTNLDPVRKAVTEPRWPARHSNVLAGPGTARLFCAKSKTIFSLRRIGLAASV